MKITFGFSKAKQWYRIGSKIIALSEKREYSHVFMKYGDEVLQAAHGRVHVLPFGEFLKEATIIKTYSTEYSDEEFNKFIKFRDKIKGRPYSRKQIIILVFLKLLGIKLNLTIDGKFSFICSELATYVLSICKSMKVPKDKDTITPSDFEKILLNNSLVEDIKIPS